MPQAENIELPEFVPAIILSGVNMFPHCLMPLFIFEPRYREMLAFALESDRVFGVATTPPGIDPDFAPHLIHPIMTVGLVRACVEHDDGTSHLMLQGLKRVHIEEWDATRDFRIARSRPADCVDRDTDEAKSLAADVIDLTTQLSGEGQPMSERVQAHLRGVNCASAVADVVAQNFLIEPEVRQDLLEELNVVKRLEFLSGFLQKQISAI